MAQSQKTSQDWAPLSSNVRLPSMKTLQPIRYEPPAWQWRCKQSPMPSAGLPQEVIVGPHMPPSSQIQSACYKKWTVEWEAQTGMCQWSTSTVENSCGCTVLDMPEKREMTKQIDWRAKATLTSGLLLGRSWGAQSQGHHIIDRLEERGM